MTQATYDNLRAGYRTQGAPTFETAGEVMLIADNANVSTRAITTLYVSSDNTTAANRTFTLTDGDAAGHRLTLIFVSAASTTCDLAETGNLQLAGAWQPAQWDTLSLYWNGTYWIELARSNN